MLLCACYRKQHTQTPTHPLTHRPQPAPSHTHRPQPAPSHIHRPQPAPSHTHRPQPVPSQEPLPSQCVQYGELELFLIGQQLRDLLPLFRQRKVQFSDLMSLTETDLGMVCVGGGRVWVGGCVCVCFNIFSYVKFVGVSVIYKCTLSDCVKAACTSLYLSAVFCVPT